MFAGPPGAHIVKASDEHHQIALWKVEWICPPSLRCLRECIFLHKSFHISVLCDDLPCFRLAPYKSRMWFASGTFKAKEIALVALSFSVSRSPLGPSLSGSSWGCSGWEGGWQRTADAPVPWRGSSPPDPQVELLQSVINYVMPTIVLPVINSKEFWRKDWFSVPVRGVDLNPVSHGLSGPQCGGWRWSPQMYLKWHLAQKREGKRIEFLLRELWDRPLRWRIIPPVFIGGNGRSENEWFSGHREGKRWSWNLIPALKPESLVFFQERRAKEEGLTWANNTSTQLTHWWNPWPLQSRVQGCK